MGRRRAANLAKFRKPDPVFVRYTSSDAGVVRFIVPLRDSPIDTYDEPDNAGVATGISDEDRVWIAKLREIGGTAATHDEPTQISETQKLKQLIKNIDFERFKTLERDNIEQEKIKRENIKREILNLKNS